MTVAPPCVLVVEDDRAFRRVYGQLLGRAGYQVIEADDRASAARAFAEQPFAVAILDLMLPPDGTTEGGLAQLAELVGQRPDAKIVVASGAGDVATMVAATKLGAYDFLTKPVDPDVLLIVVARALRRVELEREVEALRHRLDAGGAAEGAMVGGSAVFARAVALAERVATSDLPVLITGENGTGKELMARAIHQASPRKAGRFVPVNCGAIPEALIESIFFGHVRGAFTGADQARPGLFREAHGGTLFLDELGDMPVHLQVKVLRALESGEVLPVGASRAEHADVRIVSATHQDLPARIAAGSFREDLFWRIKGAEIRLPPLRERKDDIPLLAQHFLARARHLAHDGKPRQLDEAAVEALLAHAWPGNLRELRHEMQRATVISGERRVILPEDLSFTGAERAPASAGKTTTLPAQVEALERREIRAVLDKLGGNRSRASAELGLSRQGLLKKMERYGIA